MNGKKFGATPRQHCRPWGANDAELQLARLIESRGKSELIRSGWPDFLLRRRRDNKLFAVEVKTNGDPLRRSQRECFAALEAGGIPVLVWDPAMPRAFIPWRRYDAACPGRRSGDVL